MISPSAAVSHSVTDSICLTVGESNLVCVAVLYLILKSGKKTGTVTNGFFV